MRTPRLNLRTLLVLVALAALITGGVVYARRAAKYQSLAALEAWKEKYYRWEAQKWRRNLGNISPEVARTLGWAAARQELEANYHARRRVAYLHCARCPWISPPKAEPEFEIKTPVVEDAPPPVPENQ